jgi:hypothetical protein
MAYRFSVYLVFLIAVLAFIAGPSSAFCQAFAPSQNTAPNKAALAAHATELRHTWIRQHPNTPLPTTGPSITAGSITTPIILIRTPPATPGVSFNFITGPAGMAYAYFYFIGPEGQTITVSYFPYDSPTSGSFTVLSPGRSLNEYQQAGIYKLTAATIADYVGNSTDYTEAQLASIFSRQTFRVINPGASDGTPPKVFSGKIVTPTVSLSAARPVFAIDLTVSDTVSGVANVSLVLTAPDGSFSTAAYGRSPSPITKTGTLRSAANFTYETDFPTGTWSITDINIIDYAGNQIEISDAAQIKSLLGSATFQLTN